MNKQEVIDKNMVVETTICQDGTVWRNARSSPFSIHGLMYADGAFRRLPEAVAKTVSKGVLNLHHRCSGGRVRFRTDSPYISIRAKMHSVFASSIVSLCGVDAFDLYADGCSIRSMRPPLEMGEGYECRVELDGKTMRDIMIFFPTYAGVNSLEIGLEEGCCLEAAAPYPNEKPIVFYGSSITQGAAASRTGLCYTNMVCRELGRDIWNLGFSGNGKGEKEIVDYIASLPMECFVCDYDHNAPTVEHLQATHEPLYRAVRAAHPDIPILLMCKPRFVVNENTRQRMEVIRRTYENAKAAGDENVYLLTGPELMAIAGYDGMVDGVHPNDLGFFSMAQAVVKVLKPLL